MQIGFFSIARQDRRHPGLYLRRCSGSWAAARAWQKALGVLASFAVVQLAFSLSSATSSSSTPSTRG